MDQIVSTARTNMQKAFDLLRQDFATIRTGKANAALVENIVINAYGGGAHLKILELATIHVPDHQTLVITPFDQTVIHEIEKGIADSGVGLNPIVDSNLIRISLPPLTEERRKEFVKLIHQKAENGKVMIRQMRHDAMEEIKKKNAKTVSEDEVERLEKEVQKATDEFMEKIDTLREEKEKELMSL